ncbi:PepSY domain-containing protein [Kocuria sp.]|uniref:PepSY domain-containing protein n=1 Tax=Kocuria sp. TaxID=1871328 RepID=UPI0026DFED05|nr:PepSY domain-containing protein [Kocuria sp.]MDO5618870.1 PepSY domain-containing protein [Kocuria sp.]
MRNKRLATTTVLTSAALALALSGCGTQPGADDDVDGANSGTPVPTAEQTTAQADPTATTATDEATAGAATSGGDANSAQNAIENAQSQVGGEATEIDFDDDNEWEVTLVSDGQSTEVTLSADGGDIVKQDDPDSLDSDDQQEFDSAQISLADAITTATDQHPGNIDEAELTTEDGTVAYKVDLYIGADNSELTVYVDASNGDVLKTS